MSNMIGFVTLHEYQQQYGGCVGEHEQCETPLHIGMGIDAFVVIALIEEHCESLTWGACKECFAGIDNEIPGMWHLGRPK